MSPIRTRRHSDTDTVSTEIQVGMAFQIDVILTQKYLKPVLNCIEQLTFCSPVVTIRRWQLKCDGTRAETRFRLSAKWNSPFKSVGASVQSNAGSRSVRNSGSNAGYTMFRGSVKSTGYPLHLPISPSLPHPFDTVCHHISTGI